jgi:hypothetical protein
MSAPKISYCKIFPPIGFARLGNSPDAFFIGPEAPEVVSDNDGSYKDSEGRVKRQAARFRVYAFDDQDRVIAELTSEHPDVSTVIWEVTLANKKAEWYQFDGATRVADILAGETEGIPRRNDSVKGNKRKGLIIGPARQTIEGRSKASDPLQGEFVLPDAKPETVTLGELKTDEAGRLLVLGGGGRSDTVIDDNPLRHYANNNGWFDDASDGPVAVEVKMKDGSKLDVRGRAWVIVAPPHFSPYTKSVVTLYDVMSEAAADHMLDWPGEFGPAPDPSAPVSFTRDIYPILERLSLYQWISGRAARGHANGKRGGFLDDEMLRKLADPDAASKPRSPHKIIFSRVRTPIIHPPFLDVKAPHEGLLHPKSQEAVNQANLYFMPPLAGDEGDVRQNEPETWLSVTETQYRKLSDWKDGKFTADWNGVPAPLPLETLALEHQPETLTRAALENCQGGAFYPGIEITSVVRFESFYAGAFRVSDKYEAGDITRWMALPWQADFYECSGHWWPSVRPDDVVPVDEYAEVIEKFKKEAQDGDLASLLISRKPWARGIDLELPNRPRLPSPKEGDTPERYALRCTEQLGRFAAYYLRIVDVRFEPDANESLEAYRRRVEEFIARTIVDPSDDTPDFSLPVPQGGETAAEYHARVVQKLKVFLAEAVEVPPPGSPELPPPRPSTKDPLKRYAESLDSFAGENGVWQGLFDVEWRRRVENRGKDEMVKKWSQLGFVVRRQEGEATVYVEADRDRFSLLSFRDYFYHLMNIEQHPEFLPKARELAEEYLAKAREQIPDLADDPRDSHYSFFKYDAVTFRARMEKIYEINRRRAERYNPTLPSEEPLFRTPAQVVERIRQLAPFNQLDGAWLEKATKAGPIDDINSFLFEIWSDEIGNGDPAQNHANVYTDLMHSAGIYLPPLNSAAYAQHPTLWEAAFNGPAYQSAIAQFPETYFPELLGMTLYLEWEANFLPAMVKLYDYHGYSPLFYRLHVAIDNPVNGHGARARDAVIRYLGHVGAESGEQEMQEHWRRIWDGYIAFGFIGNEEWSYRFTNPLTLDEQMIEMFQRKRHYAQLNHGLRRLGVNFINDWFDEPDQFLEELANSDWITKGDAKASKIFSLMGPTGPMLKVFGADEIRLWQEWINALPRDPVGADLGPGQAMMVLLREFQARGTAVPEHGGPKLKGKYFDQATDGEVDADQPVSWWFQLGQPRRFMEALRDPANGWVIPGNVTESRLFTTLLASNSRMSRFLAQTVPELGDKPARKIIIDWIASGCDVPGDDAVPAHTVITAATADTRARSWEQPTRDLPLREVEEETAKVLVRSMNAAPLSREQRSGMRQRRYGPGGGAPH